MLQLHGYWRSTASYRVRIALNLKGLNYSQVTHDLRIGAQAAPEYGAINPQQLVPTIQNDSMTLGQSLAIMEWIDDTYPWSPLLPSKPCDRAIVRAMANMIACDIHPLNNLRVLKALRANFGAEEDQISSWIARWIHEGFASLEALVARHGNGCAFGDRPTLADCCLVPQIYSARRFDVDLKAYPHLLAVMEKVGTLPAMLDAHPDRQPDAD